MSSLAPRPMLQRTWSAARRERTLLVCTNCLNGMQACRADWELVVTDPLTQETCRLHRRVDLNLASRKHLQTGRQVAAPLRTFAERLETRADTSRGSTP